MFKKLKDNTGASLMIALCFLLICVLVCSVILSAASANVNRINRRAAEQQAQYTLSSAAQLLADGIGTVDYLRVQYGPISGDCGDSSQHAYANLDPQYDDYSPYIHKGKIELTGGNNQIQNAFEGAILIAADAVYEGRINPAFTYTKEFSISAAGMENVNAKVVMDANYNISFTFWLENTNCGRIMMYYQATPNEMRQTPTQVHEYTTGSFPVVTETCTYSCQRTITTVSWSGPPYISELEATN